MPITSPEVFRDMTVDLDPKVNPYVSKVVDASADEGSPVRFGPALQGMAGQWREALGVGPKAKLVLEIGCHNGHTLAEMASKHPDWGFVGVDITFKRVMKTSERLVQSNCKNAIVALANARGLQSLFAKGELDYLVLFFPDPWCKKKSQAKKRLLNETFAHTLFDLIAPSGGVWFKTDHGPYAAEGHEALLRAGFAAANGLPRLSDATYESSFEKRFRSRGVTTSENFARKAATISGKKAPAIDEQDSSPIFVGESS